MTGPEAHAPCIGMPREDCPDPQSCGLVVMLLDLGKRRDADVAVLEAQVRDLERQVKTLSRRG